VNISTEREYTHAQYIASELRRQLIPGQPVGIRYDILRRLLPIESAIVEHDQRMRALRESTMIAGQHGTR
jgi:hypothetical protein